MIQRDPSARWSLNEAVSPTQRDEIASINRPPRRRGVAMTVGLRRPSNLSIEYAKSEQFAVSFVHSLFQVRAQAQTTIAASFSVIYMLYVVLCSLLRHLYPVRWFFISVTLFNGPRMVNRWRTRARLPSIRPAKVTLL